MAHVVVKSKLTKEEFINESGLEFKDISSESFREYHFPNGERLFIDAPLFLHASASGGHRLFDAYGVSYYIQPSQGWYIRWQAGEGKPHFVK